MNLQLLEKLCKKVRYDILVSTTEAGSGHPSSSLSAVELAVTLFFGGFFHFDPEKPEHIFNDRFILSKGHASPLLYSLYHAAGWIDKKQLMSLRKFESDYEGHPTPRIPFVDVATGSLGQGLSAGVGMALAMNFNVKRLTLNVLQKPKVFVLLGDSEMAEGQVWEAMEIAGHYKLNNLVAILDVNRLGQRGETMLGWDLKTYAKRAEAFGWKAIVVEDGHNIENVYEVYTAVVGEKEKPVILIAKTAKGKGTSLLENKDDWHGKPVPKDKLQTSLDELGEVDFDLREEVQMPNNLNVKPQSSNKDEQKFNVESLKFKIGDLIATREAYGEALVELGKINDNIVAFDGEVSNSTYSDKFKKAFPERFFEMFIAEQNMITAALGASKVGLIPFVSSFAAFLTRAYDQIRMAQYSKPNLKIVGSHAGVSIGQDGPSQMGLEDLAMMRSVLDSIVFYPSDGLSTAKLTKIMAENTGLYYLRTTREKTPVIYDGREEFVTGGSKILKQSDGDKAVVFAAGITLHEALKAYDTLQKEELNITVVDLYSVKPLDENTVRNLTEKVKNIIVVEDHYPAGGLGEAVSEVISRSRLPVSSFTHLSVRHLPRSGSPAQLLKFEEIDSQAIIKAVKALV